MGETENLTASPPAGGTASNESPAQAATATPEPQAGDGTHEHESHPERPERPDRTESISLDEARKLRSEAANLRKRLKAYEEEKAKAQEAQLSEQQKLEKRLAELQAEHETVRRQMQERGVNSEVRLQAAQMGIVDPSAAAKLLDWSEIEYDDDGAPTNIPDLLKKLLKVSPYLAGKSGSGAGSLPANPARSASTAPQPITWEYLGTITPQEYSARQKEIREFMAKNPPRFR